MTDQDQTNLNNSFEDDRIDLQELFGFLWAVSYTHLTLPTNREV